MLSGDLETQRTLENIKYISDLKVGKKKRKWNTPSSRCLVEGAWSMFDLGTVPTFLMLN